MDAKAEAESRLEGVLLRLIELSHRIHAHPELGFEERKAASWIEQMLAEYGFEVQAGAFGLPTAFCARAGSGAFHVAFCAEYDALPEIGHACGHNIIAAAAVGAGIAASGVADRVDLSVSVIGTPGEESGDAGGKILLLERGAFDQVHAAMMVHPGPFDVLTPPFIAASMFEVRYTGKEAHAAAFPEAGINAADALTIAQTAIGLLRQHILPTDRIHGIITYGGDAPNVIPARTTARYIVRSRTLAELEDLRPRVYRCFEAGALATGCKLEIIGGKKPYSELVHDPDMAAVYRRNSELLGRSFTDAEGAMQKAVASTDMGNLSLVLPCIHPMIISESLLASASRNRPTGRCAMEHWRWLGPPSI